MRGGNELAGIRDSEETLSSSAGVRRVVDHSWFPVPNPDHSRHLTPARWMNQELCHIWAGFDGGHPSDPS